MLHTWGLSMHEGELPAVASNFNQFALNNCMPFHFTPPICQQWLQSFLRCKLGRVSRTLVRSKQYQMLAPFSYSLQVITLMPVLPLQVRIHDDKALAFLEETSRVFETVLDAEDARDGPAIEKIMHQLESAEQSDIVQHLVKELYHKKKPGS